jgi:hypothetical protein
MPGSPRCGLRGSFYEAEPDRRAHFDIAASRVTETAGRDEVLATGAAGTVYLCHRFLVHAAQLHRGSEPRFMAQPPLPPRRDFQLERANEAYSPVEVAIRQSLRMP